MKKISPFSLKRKRVLIFLSVSIITLSLIPYFSTYAADLPFIGKALTALPSVFVSLIFKLILYAINGVLYLTDYILTWIANDPFSKTLSFTDPGNNPILQVGWTLLRDMVNMFFILGLAYIGLATALGLSGFDTKKTFGKLILVALIINFTPVICGVIVDASNLIGNFFIKGISFKAIAERFSYQQGLLSQHWTNLLTSTTVLMQTLMLMAYGLGGAFVLLIFSLLLLARYVMIWLAVILSPLAFFFSIFRGTKKIYDQWWHQFTQWSFVIIPAGFFLYISRQALANVDKFSDYTGDPSGGFFPAISPYIISLLFLYIGFFLTTKTTAMGASLAIKGANKIGKYSVGAVGLGAFGAAKRIRNYTKNKIGPYPGEEGWDEYKISNPKGARVKEAIHGATRFAFSAMTEEEKQRWGRTKKGKVLKAAKTITRGGLSLVTLGAPIWAKPIHDTLASKLDKSVDEGINKEKRKMKDMSLIDKKNYMDKALMGKGPIFKNRRIAGLISLAETGDLKKVYPNDKEREAVIRRIFKETLAYKPEAMKDLQWLDPAVASEVARDAKIPKKTLARAGMLLTDKDREKGWLTLEDKLIATASPGKMEYWTKSFAEKAAKSVFAHKFWTGRQLAKGIELFGTSFADKFKEGMLEITKTEGLAEKDAIEKQKEFYKKNNPYLKNYLESSPAKSLGIGFGLNREKQETLSGEELKRMKKEYAQEWEKGTLSQEEKLESQKIKVENLRKEWERLKKEEEKKENDPDITYQAWAAEVAFENAKKKLDKMEKRMRKFSKETGNTNAKEKDVFASAGNSKKRRSAEDSAGNSKKKK